jgi:hypothetical protein
LPNTSLRVKSYDDPDVAVIAKETIPVVVKTHGTIDAVDDIIFTRSDYIRARNDHAAFYAILEALAITKTFLFLGCGLNDPDIRVLLEDQAFTYKGAPSHYLVIAKNEIPSAHVPAIEGCLNVKLLTYSNPAKDHSHLKPAIDELVGLVGAERNNIQVNRSW